MQPLPISVKPLFLSRGDDRMVPWRPPKNINLRSGSCTKSPAITSMVPRTKTADTPVQRHCQQQQPAMMEKDTISRQTTTTSSCQCGRSAPTTTIAAVVTSPANGYTLTCQESSSQTRSIRRVRFAERAKRYRYIKHDDEEWDIRCVEDTNIDRKKRRRYLQGRAWQAKGYGKLLNDAFFNPQSGNLEVFVLLPEDDYMRGAENYLNDDFRRDRMIMRHEVRARVLEREMELKLEGKSTKDEITEQLAILSMELSSPARTFAIQMGLADEYAVLFANFADENLLGNEVVDEEISSGRTSELAWVQQQPSVVALFG